jgi:hypothetical protein
MCAYFENLWADTQRLRVRALRFPHREETTYPRLEVWWRRRPPEGKHRCKCGCSDDALGCWLAVQSKELMGEGRADNGVKMLVDREVIEEEGR